MTDVLNTEKSVNSTVALYNYVSSTNSFLHFSC